MVSRWSDFARSPIVPMNFPGHKHSHRAAVRLVVLTGIFSLVGLFLALGVGADRADRFSKTCSMGTSCCVNRARGELCDHPPAEARHDVPPGVRRVVGFEIEAACGCPAPASAFVFRNDGLITPSDFTNQGEFTATVGCFRRLPASLSLWPTSICPRAPPSVS